jgi:hypothetical protein
LQKNKEIFLLIKSSDKPQKSAKKLHGFYLCLQFFKGSEQIQVDKEQTFF